MFLQRVFTEPSPLYGDRQPRIRHQDISVRGAIGSPGRVVHVAAQLNVVPLKTLRAPAKMKYFMNADDRSYLLRDVRVIEHIIFEQDRVRPARSHHGLKLDSGRGPGYPQASLSQEGNRYGWSELHEDE